MIKTAILVVLMTAMCDLRVSADLEADVRAKRAENGYILRSCQASVQLNRKYRTNTDANTIKIRSNADYPKIISESIAKHLNKYIDKSGAERTREMRNQKVIAANHDSPFKTIDVKPTIRDRPQIFRKKDSLPQLSRVTAAKKLDAESPIIIVEKLH